MTQKYMVLCLTYSLAGLLVTTSAGEVDKLSVYSKVRIFVHSSADIRAIQERGIAIEHYQGKVGNYIDVVINHNEVDLLQSSGLSHQVLIADMDAEYAGRAVGAEVDLASSRAMLRDNGIEGFEYGSMGGFYTYTEVVRELDSMRLQYPSFVTAKESLGVSTEGRTIWGVEISDNPGVAEPEEGVAYYDALHHAREPISMSVLMYYMYWLLDNYGTNPEATYLVNNRRMLFVPVVNPDGYVYNQTTNPNGGGMWRKNRSFNTGGSRGVDLNRNYGYQWGYDNIGSSGTPTSETYRGPSAWSEPESRAVRDFTTLHQPSIAFSTHSVAGRYLNPYGYKDTVVSYEYYAEFANDFAGRNNYLYGTVYQMLDYNSNGTTRDFLHHDINCLAWTPEIGGSGFWPSQSEIVPLCQENLLACKYLSWVSGAFADYQSFRLVGRQFGLAGDTLRFAVAVRNKGLSLSAYQVGVSIQSLHPDVTPISSAVVHDSIGVRQTAENSVNPFEFMITSGVTMLTEVKFAASVTQEGIVTAVDTFSVVVGYPRELFVDDAESGLSNWVRSGNGVQWDTAFTMAYSGSRSLADSRYGNVANGTTNYLTTTNTIDLASTLNPRLEYFARWANESGFDYTRIQISTNNGSIWTNLVGRYTTMVAGGPGYTANKGFWAWEHINLGSYAGHQIKLRFNQVSDFSLRGDGFYFDDFRIVDYRDTVVTGVEQHVEAPIAFSLQQNYPNPFNPTTTIKFSLPSRSLIKAEGMAGEGSMTTLKVYDLLGREVATLVSDNLGPGTHEVTFDASTLSSGLYFYKLRAGNFAETKKLIFLK